MKLFTIIALVLFFTTNVSAKEDFYNLEANKINGELLKFSELEGKRLMIVNTASKCTYTYQYGELQELYEMYGGDRFEIIGFPANNFANQEPGEDSDIEDFCKENYGVTFTMMSKISVIGSDIHPVYQWLTQKSKNGLTDSEVKWNFQKYLIKENGDLYAIVASNISPLHSQIQNWIKKYVTGVEEFENVKLKVYPNPASEILNIQLPDISNEISIALIDAAGNIAFENDYNSANAVIPVTGLSSGAYILKIHSVDFSIMRKVIIR